MNTNVPQLDDSRLKDALADVKARFQSANPFSFARWKKAKEVMPGGNTRSILHYDPFPVMMQKGEGSSLTDMDGHHYLDFLGEYSAGLYGHSNSVIQDAIKEAVDGGTVLGAPNRWEARLAELICQRFPSIDQVRFTNSGTEANLMALGAARAFTGREKIMVFDGSYHGGVLYFAHGGSPVNVPFEIVYGIFNDIQSTLDVIEASKNDLAAVIVEPMMGAGGCLLAEPDFLSALREATRANEIVLIFDEVMTSRTSSGGLQQHFGITPDMSTLGKYLGGGVSFGAFGGRLDIMELFDPALPKALPHAGTFNNNVMSMAAGCAGLGQVFTTEVADALYEKGESFKTQLNTLIKNQNLSMQVTGVGSLLNIHMTGRPIRSPGDLDDIIPEKHTLIHLEMMLRGFMYAQRGYMALSIPMTQENLDAFADTFEEVIDVHADLLQG